MGTDRDPKTESVLQNPYTNIFWRKRAPIFILGSCIEPTSTGSLGTPT